MAIQGIFMFLSVMANLKRDGKLDLGSLVDQILPVLMQRFMGSNVKPEDAELIKTLIAGLLDNIKDRD